MSQHASQVELNKFVEVIDEFKAKHTQLSLPSTRAQVYATKNAQLISDYDKAVSRGNALNATIANLVGAWDAAKRGWSVVTDTTSLVIGDAVDWFRNLWGGGPNTENLGAVPIAAIPAAVVMAGIIATATVLISSFDKIFVHLNANAIQKQNPGVNRATALAQAKTNLPTLFGGISLKMIAVGAIALYFIMGRK